MVLSMLLTGSGRGSAVYLLHGPPGPECVGDVVSYFLLALCSDSCSLFIAHLLIATAHPRLWPHTLAISPCSLIKGVKLRK
jgi:hypothetical protein